MAMAGVSADNFGETETAAFTTTVATLLDGIEEEHIGNVAATDGSRRRLDQSYLGDKARQLSSSCTITFDIQAS